MNANILESFNANPGVRTKAIEAFENSRGYPLPDDYTEFLRCADGGEGFIGDKSYLILWKLEELEEFNRDYEVADYCNGLLLFGSSGGGEAYGFDTRKAEWPVVQVPFVGMDYSHVEEIAGSFNDFLVSLGRQDQSQ